MGVAVADYDEDGYFDILKTNFSEDTPNLYHNSKDGSFLDEVYSAGLGVRNQFRWLGSAVPGASTTMAARIFCWRTLPRVS